MTTTEPRRRLPLRGRIVGWFVAIVATALMLVLGTAWSVLRTEVAERANRAIVQEADEFRAFVTEAKEPNAFRDTAELLEAFLMRQRADDGELLVGYLHRTGQLLENPGPDTDALIMSDEELRRQMLARESGVANSPAGEIRWGRVDVRSPSGDGSLIVVMFTGQQSSSVTNTIRTLIPIAAFALLVTGVLAWVVSGWLLRPIRAVQQTAADINERDLTRRLPVEGDDELAHLAVTFNAMLDRLEEAFAAEHQFVDDAGHELRTPITIIRGHLELMGDDPEERRATVALVTRELDRMSRMVTDLLVLAKAGRPDYIQLDRPVDVAELTLDLDASLQTLGDRRWVLDQVAEGLALVDRQRVTQAVLQLAANAVQHTRSGDTIRLGSTFVDAVDGRRCLRFAVADSGDGVPDAEKGRVFDRFYRGDSNAGGSGAGLGLAIVKSIAAGHGGSVAVTDTPGGGATFTLTVPARLQREEVAVRIDQEVP